MTISCFRFFLGLLGTEEVDCSPTEVMSIEELGPSPTDALLPLCLFFGGIAPEEKRTRNNIY